MTIKQDLIDIAENVSKVHEAGKKTEYDAGEFYEITQDEYEEICVKQELEATFTE